MVLSDSVGISLCEKPEGTSRLGVGAGYPNIGPIYFLCASTPDLTLVLALERGLAFFLLPVEGLKVSKQLTLKQHPRFGGVPTI